MKYIVSARGMVCPGDPVEKIFEFYSKFGAPGNLHSVYAFPEDFSPLFGGRRYIEVFIEDRQVDALREHGIYYDMPLSNHFFTEKTYKDTIPLLKKHYKKGNSIICTNNDLAKRIRQDFPEYTLRGSSIQGNDTAAKIEKALELYDFVTLPVRLSCDPDLLTAIRQKDRVIPFANHTCALYCRHNKCYLESSKWNSSWPNTQNLSEGGHFCMRGQGYKEYDTSHDCYKGFTLFKLIPGRFIDKIPLNVEITKPGKTHEIPEEIIAAWRLASEPKVKG